MSPVRARPVGRCLRSAGRFCLGRAVRPLTLYCTGQYNRESMGATDMLDPMRTTSGGKRPVSTYLWPDEHDGLERAAAELRITKAEILRQALREWLERREREAKR